MRIQAERQETLDYLVKSHIDGVHLNKLINERQLTINRLQDDMNDANMKRFQTLTEKGLTQEQALSLLGRSGTMKLEEREEKIDFPEWAKEQNYESWRSEFDTYQELYLGEYAKVEIIAEADINKVDPTKRHASNKKKS